MEVGAQAADGLYFVGMKEELIAAKRTVLTLDGRDVLLIHHQGEFYAIDCYCYHAGTSLQNGDMSQRCIICPKHKYKISLSPVTAPLRWFSKGVKQRVHQLTERQGALFIRLSGSGWVESDYYQGEQGRVARERAASKDSGGEEDSTE
uniref:Rieske domain-containing protein n=1 Tax=Neogobius melanostomus TaxID=47308 RepID=A0A8C6UAY6_9GOBI